MSKLREQNRPMRADARRNRTRILDAARELFASDSPEIQMDDVARCAGVGVGTVYRHFPDKEALMGELVRERFGIFNANMRAALDDREIEPFAALAAVMRANAASVADDAATRFAFMSGGERVFAHAAAEMTDFMVLADSLVQRARAGGELRADFQAADIPMVMCGVCATVGKREAGWDWHRHLELVLSGMRVES
jgi:AcrR family transcriptional regulator